jgi:hypothetical protein
MMTISSISDVRTWAANCGGLTTADVDSLVESIHNDGDGERPAWGQDWSWYLDRIDVAATVLAGEVVLLPKREWPDREAKP